MMNHQPEIAIVEANTLTSLGLKTILERMIPMAVIRTFHSFGELTDDTPDMYAHYFISAQIYGETATSSNSPASPYSTSTRQRNSW